MISTTDLAGSIRGLIKAIETIRETKSTNMVEYTKRASVAARCYIEGGLIDEPITHDILKVMYNLYLSYIFATLELSQFVSGNRTVRDVLRIVATESFGQRIIDESNIVSDFTNAMAGMESAPTITRTTSKEFTDKQAIGSSKLVEVGIQVPDTDKTLSAHLMVRLLPRVIEPNVMEQFLTLNMRPSIYKQYLMWRADEYTFWKDFVFQMKSNEERRKALKNDRTGDLTYMLGKQRNAVVKHFIKLLRAIRHTTLINDDGADLLSESPDNQNIANSILVYEENTFRRACHKAGYNFNNFHSRQKFFNKAYAMFVIVIDRMGGDLVTMYTNSLDAVSHFNPGHLADSAKRDTLQIATLARQMAGGSSIRI